MATAVGLRGMVLVVVALLSASSSALERPRGVSQEKAAFYQGSEFKCLSDGKVLPLDHVNDDYCDCADGSDEPGTSACNNGLFYCENKPYKGSYILSSRVNDGVCDCCDGSDEYDGTISCENTCEKMFAEIRAQQEAFRQKQEKGYKTKLEYIQQGKRTKDEKMARLSEMEKNKEKLVEERATLEVAKEEAEEPEKAAKEKHEKAWEAVKEQKRKEKEAVAAGEAFAVLDVNQDGSVDIPEIQSHSEFDIDSDGTVSDEEAKEYLEENESADLATFTEKIWPNIKEIYKKPEDASQGDGEPERVPDAGESPDDPFQPPVYEDKGEGEYKDEEDLDEDDDEEEEDDEEDDLDIYDVKRSEEGAKLNENIPEEEKMPEYDEETKALIAAADAAREKHSEADQKVRDTEREISEIKKYLELDFGPNEEFSALQGNCFEHTDREYTYKFCPFDRTTQRPKGGGIETSLGNWGHWHGPQEDKYDAMKFENGQGCWNGPARSCHVNLHCGAENELIGASEPSRCEYQFEFTTPARCDQPSQGSEHAPHEEL